jgi:hypothetical protein
MRMDSFQPRKPLFALIGGETYLLEFLQNIRQTAKRKAADGSRRDFKQDPFQLLQARFAAIGHESCGNSEDWNSPGIHVYIADDCIR